MRVVRPSVLAFAVVAAIAATAAAEPRRIVVNPFDAPTPALASAGRAAVMSALASEWTIVASDEWQRAFDRAKSHGPDRYNEASCATNVFALIEGWIQPDGPAYVLTIAIRDAANGAEQPFITVDMAPDGQVAPADARRLADDLHDELSKLRPRRCNDVIDTPKPQATTPTPIVQASAGPYVARRTLSFSRASGSMLEMPSYPGHTVAGAAIHVAAFPVPEQKVDGPLAGFGISVDASRSLTSSSTGGGYTLRHIAWQGALHYRQPVSSVVLDADVNVGNTRYALLDRPDARIPNASYAHFGGGVHVDDIISDELMIGAGAHYTHPYDIGQIGTLDYYGQATTARLLVEATGIYKINQLWFVRAALDWQRVWLSFIGEGDLADVPMRVHDDCLTATIQIGVSH